jgi:hypothetical protein
VCVLYNVSMHQDIVKPIRPAEAKKQKEENWERDLPAPVLAAINDTIVEHIEPGSFTINQDVMIRVILARLAEGRAGYNGKEENMPYCYAATRQDIINNKWLDFEPMYRKAGWDIEYVKPGIGDLYVAYWRFNHR